jgi:uncharacterized membrane protein YgcG
MASTTLVEAGPQTSQGQAVAVRLAGGGAKAYTHKGFNDWRAGISVRARFSAGAGWNDSGPNGAAVPQTADIVWYPSDRSNLSQLANLYWKGALIVVSAGDDELPNPVWSIRMVGTVADVKTDGGRLTLTIGDLTTALNKTLLPNTFAGTGDLEGGSDAVGRVKRRTWGTVFNVEGFLLDAANNVYEFGDPAQPINAFVLVKDKGYPAGSTNTIGWQGDALSTLNALRAASVPSGGAVVAPSICCVKWWTQPSGPLTADLQGEVGTGFVTTMAEITARLLTIYAPTAQMGNMGDALSWRSATVGVHVDDTNETIANVLDRLIIPMTCMWAFTPTGLLFIRQMAWTGSVEALQADTVARDATFQPLLTRKLGFQRNYRIHSAGEVSAAIVSTDVTYADGTAIDVLKPAQAGADRTSLNNAASFQGQGRFATVNSASYGSSLLTGFGALAPLDSASYGSEFLKGFGALAPLGSIAFGQQYILSQTGFTATDAAYQTAQGNAASFQGQGGLATRNSVSTGQIDPASASDMIIMSNTNTFTGSGDGNTGSATGGSGGSVSSGGSGGSGGGGHSSGSAQP